MKHRGVALAPAAGRERWGAPRLPKAVDADALRIAQSAPVPRGEHARTIMVDWHRLRIAQSRAGDGLRSAQGAAEACGGPPVARTADAGGLRIAQGETGEGLRIAQSQTGESLRIAQGADEPGGQPGSPQTPDGDTSRCEDGDLGALGARFRTMQAREVLALWRWTQALVAASERRPAEPDLNTPGDPKHVGRLTLVEIAVLLGERAPGKLYSPGFVSRALTTAYVWPEPPVTEAEKVAFRNRFNGHANRVSYPDETPEARRGRALRSAAGALERALALGCPLDDICQVLRATLGSGVDIRLRAGAESGRVRGAGVEGGGPEVNHA